ncbi:hypothetical protein CAC42_5189 [Sphaceloma murrayae]|uniref:C2H2-type domain-containing protein n=1 Tax=Sphaceloma murrayae TaxID=2082308 RepID=A0A2K1QUM5_9PEZI|nr:hypothetical protein CAC42_5189 [Sphaceloma murrayae]
MTTILNGYPSAHHMLNDRMPVNLGSGYMPYVSSAAWQEQSNFVAMPNMVDDSAYLRQSQAMNENLPWMFRPPATSTDLDFASEASAASSPFPFSAESLFRASPHIKTEDSDSGSAAMTRTRSTVLSSYSDSSPHQYQFPVAPAIKEERKSPVLNAVSSHSPSSSHSRSSHESIDQDIDSEGDLSTGARRKRRTYASEESGKHQCHICKQYFRRSYNLKAHMKTHDPSRLRAFVCGQPSCNRSFERKADLTRHFESVHIRDKKYPCEHCGSGFTRKDTARRHMDDGCSKRWEQRQRRATNSRKGKQRSVSAGVINSREGDPMHWP